MKEKQALKLAGDITRVKTLNDTYFPLQLVRKDEDDMMIIVQTTAPIGPDIFQELKDLGKDVDLTVGGTYIIYA